MPRLPNTSTTRPSGSSWSRAAPAAARSSPATTPMDGSTGRRSARPPAAGDSLLPDSSDVAGLTGNIGEAMFSNVSVSPLWFSAPPEVNGSLRLAAYGHDLPALRAGPSRRGIPGSPHLVGHDAPARRGPAHLQRQRHQRRAEYHRHVPRPRHLRLYRHHDRLGRRRGRQHRHRRRQPDAHDGCRFAVAGQRHRRRAQSFTATLEDQFGDAIPYAAYTWAASAAAALSRQRRPYTAPNALGTDTLTVTAATSVARPAEPPRSTSSRPCPPPPPA